MAIKINWKDLQKRIINWKEVEKVMCNWVQIRPEQQWPFPDWLHVPTYAEMNTLLYIMNEYNYGISDYEEYLHMPQIHPLSTDGETSNAYPQYWTSGSQRYPSQIYGYPVYLFKTLIFNSFSWIAINDVFSVRASSLRLFAHEYDPEGDRREIANWISYDATQWLIYVTDWTYWRIISDKNFGATTVYNRGDTITQANGGYLYQWWNCYGFPITWATKTSSTQVDTTGYGNWNYYTDDTFIAVWGNANWFSPDNTTLRP